jgi:hypothetical protein
VRYVRNWNQSLRESNEPSRLKCLEGLYACVCVKFQKLHRLHEHRSSRFVLGTYFDNT